GRTSRGCEPRWPGETRTERRSTNASAANVADDLVGRGIVERVAGARGAGGAGPVALRTADGVAEQPGLAHVARAAGVVEVLGAVGPGVVGAHVADEGAHGVREGLAGGLRRAIRLRRALVVAVAKLARGVGVDADGELATEDVAEGHVGGAVAAAAQAGRIAGQAGAGHHAGVGAGHRI